MFTVQNLSFTSYTALIGCVVYEALCVLLAIQFAAREVEAHPLTDWTLAAMGKCAAINYVWRSFLFGDLWRKLNGVPHYAIKSWSMGLGLLTSAGVAMLTPLPLMAALGVGVMSGMAFGEGCLVYLKTTRDFQRAARYQEGIEMNVVKHGVPLFKK